MRPIIGVVARPEKLESGNEIYYINREINESVIKNGGITVIIVPNMIEQFVNKTITNTKAMDTNEFNQLKEIIDMCDGIICQGGDNFYDYDLKIIDYCYKINKPLFGICLGMQAMGYLFNGSIGKLKNSSHKSKNKYVHNVNLDKTSKLYDIFKSSKIDVNSRHEDYIIDTNLDIVGISSDGVIEAIEDKRKTFFIGVQWHPESMIEYDILENELFSHFIECCRGKK